MEVPRLGVESELQPLAYARATAMRDPSCVCNLHQSSWQRRIVNLLCHKGTPQVFFCLFVFCLFRAALMAYGSSQARGQIGATAASLRHSHSNRDPSHMGDLHA